MVTVVIPVYNTEQYLDDCIRSVVSQTYKKLQILLIDDGSTDKSPRICEEWAWRDGRITVIHKVNEGLGMARNTGILHAKGEYLCFLDSDDFLWPEAIGLARKEAAEAVFYGFQSVEKTGKLLETHVPHLEKQTYSGKEVQNAFLPMLIAGEKGLQASVCWGMFSMDLVRRANWRFPSERDVICEDVFALLDLFRFVRSVAVLPKALYYYRKNPASLSRACRVDRFEKAKAFYQKCEILCQTAEYSTEVLAACREPVLALAILAMKQGQSETVLRDPFLREIVGETKGRGWKRKVLFWSIRREWDPLCRVLLSAQRWKDGRT